MFSKILTSFKIIIVLAVACISPRSMSPSLAQKSLADSWRSDYHIVWEIDWPASPIGGPVTVETWRAGDRYRYEILESAAPAMVGQTLVFDGENAWRYNRFEPPASFVTASPRLAPVTDAFAIVERLVDGLPETAHQAEAQLNRQPVRRITASFANNDRLSVWSQTETGLPLQIQFRVEGQKATLTAREFEPLPDPPAELFGVGDWIRHR